MDDSNHPPVSLVVSRRALLGAGAVTAAAYATAGVPGLTPGLTPSAAAAVSPQHDWAITVDEFSRDKTILDAGLVQVGAARNAALLRETLAGADPTRTTRSWGVDPAPAGIGDDGNRVVIDTDVATPADASGWRFTDRQLVLVGGGTAAGGARWTLAHTAVSTTGAGVALEIAGTGIELDHCAVETDHGSPLRVRRRAQRVWIHDSRFAGQRPIRLAGATVLVEHNHVTAEVVVDGGDGVVVAGNLIEAGLRLAPTDAARGIEVRHNVVRGPIGYVVVPRLRDTDSPRVYENWFVTDAAGRYLRQRSRGGRGRPLVWQDNRDLETGRPAQPDAAGTVTIPGLSHFGGADLALHGTTAAPDGARILAEIVDDATGAVVAPGLVIGTAADGRWSGTYPRVRQQSGWLKPRVRVENSTTTAMTARRFAAGLVVVFSGQSNEAYWESGSSGRTGTRDPIADDDAVQFIYLHQRGLPSETDTGTVVGPKAITNAVWHSEGVAASAYLFTLADPGLKVLIVGDAKGGVIQNVTLDDTDNRRMFTKVKALSDAVRADGTEPGAFLIMHPNGLPDDTETAKAAYLYEAFTGRSWETDAPVTLPGQLGLTGNETLPANHVWPELFPGFTTHETVGVAMYSGYTTANTTGVPTPIAAGADGRSLLQQRDPATFLNMGNSDTTYNGIAPAHTADVSHHSATVKGGIRNHGKMMAAMTLQAMGRTGTSQPRIDQITWAAAKVVLGWSGGALTNRASQAAPGTRPTYRATGARVPVFVDEEGKLLRTEIRNAAGAQADQGRIWVYPNTSAFYRQSRIYHTNGVEPAGTPTYMANQGPEFLPLGQQNMGDFVGLEVRRIGYGTEYLNVNNTLAKAPNSDDVTLLNNGPVRVSPNLAAGIRKMTLAFAASKPIAAVSSLLQGSAANTFYWRVSLSNDILSLKFSNGVDASFDGQVAGLAALLRPVNHVQPRFRFVINTDPAGNGSQAGHVRLFVKAPGQTEIEITGSSSAYTHTGSAYGVSQAGVTGNGALRVGVGHRLFATSGVKVASARAWLNTQADGGTGSLGAPWYEAVANGSGGFTVVNLVAG